MKHRWVRALVMGTVAGVLLSCARFTAICAEIRSEVVRLHVLANSDSEEDQALKLQVRDAVLAAADGLLDGVTSTETALQTVAAERLRLQRAAEEAVAQSGYAYPVTVEMCEMYFTTRTYDAGTLPAGVYHALRVTIGEGAGHNWWCVVYPPLCLGTATRPAQWSDVLDEPACDAVEHAPRYEVRFKVVELLEEWLSAAG